LESTVDVEWPSNFAERPRTRRGKRQPQSEGLENTRLASVELPIPGPHRCRRSESVQSTRRFGEGTSRSNNAGAAAVRKLRWAAQAHDAVLHPGPASTDRRVATRPSLSPAPSKQRSAALVIDYRSGSMYIVRVMIAPAAIFAGEQGIHANIRTLRAHGPVVAAGTRGRSGHPRLPPLASDVCPAGHGDSHKGTSTGIVPRSVAKVWRPDLGDGAIVNPILYRAYRDPGRHFRIGNVSI